MKYKISLVKSFLVSKSNFTNKPSEIYNSFYGDTSWVQYNNKHIPLAVFSIIYVLNF